MTKRSRFVRVLTLLWASLQLAIPAMSSIADGQQVLESASQRTHVEATTTDSCPVVHSLDCAVCRFLTSSGAPDAAAPSLDWQLRALRTRPSTVAGNPGCAALGLPHGRAPPTV